MEERDAVLRWLAGLDSRIWNVLRLDFPNRKNDPPIPVFIQREGPACRRCHALPAPFGGLTL